VNGSLTDEIVVAIALSLLMAIAWIYAETYKLFWRLLQWLKATKRYGDEDVWDFTFNATDAAVEYVNFRDFANRIVYSGWVQSFSETGRLRELVLREAEIYDFDGRKLFAMPLGYLARTPENIHIEFPFKASSLGDEPHDQ